MHSIQGTVVVEIIVQPLLPEGPGSGDKGFQTVGIARYELDGTRTPSRSSPRQLFSVIAQYQWVTWAPGAVVGLRWQYHENH